MVDKLNVYQDGKRRNLMEWIREKGETIYTDVGKRTWRVPPVKFNVQKLSQEKLKKIENNQQYVRIEGPVLGQPPETDKETNRAENIVCGVFENLSNHIVQNGLGSAMFLISNFAYENYLNKLSQFVTDSQSDGTETKSDEVTDSKITMEPLGRTEPSQTSRPTVKLPKDVANRGELDMLILHQEAGVILVQAKAVGYNFHKSREFAPSLSIHTAVEKAGDQLSRDRNVMLYIMEDLGLTRDQITSVVALPNLPRSVLKEEMSVELKNKLCNEMKLEIDTNFLCEEDFKLDNDGCPRALEMWWQNVLLPMNRKMDLETMKQIAYRTVGLLSTVSVWAYAQPRIEVRNWNDAAWETGHRYTQVVLSPQQVELLKHEDQYLYLWGPAGSGKTLLLSLKGRQWLRRDCNVAILNTRLGSRGRTVGQVIETTINNSERLKKNAIRIDLDLMENEESLSSTVASHVKDQTFHFLLDEIAWVKETEKLLALIKKSYPYSSIWCAGMLVECQPEGFETGRLEVILRCPPSVQRVLRIVDNRDERCELYKLDSAKAGLPTDGLRAFFIIHSRHGDASIEPFDCPVCAEELSHFLLHDLNMKSEITNQSMDNQNCVQSPELKSIVGESVDGVLGSSQIEDGQTTDSRRWGSSRGSDSGCDVEYNVKDSTSSDTPGMEDSTSLDKNDNNAHGIEKDKNASKLSSKKKKKNRSGGLQNISPGERITSVGTDTCNTNINTDYIPSLEIHNPDEGISTRNLTQDEVLKTDSAKSTKTKPRSQKSRNQKSATGNESQESKVSKPGKGNPKTGQKSTTNNDSKNTPVEKSGKGNHKTGQKSTTNNDSENTPVENTGKKNSSTGQICDTSTGCGGSKKMKACKKNNKTKNSSKINQGSCEEDTSIQRLNFNDAVLPVTVPRSWHHYNKRGYWSISREALAQEMVLLGSSEFCQRLYYSGVPLKVEEAMVMKAEGKASENHFVLCPVGAVHGLEYKLVVCVPSACALPEYTYISEGIRNGQIEPKILMKRTQFATDYLKNKDKLSFEQSSTEVNRKNEPKIDKVRISTHVAEEGAPYDILYEPAPEDSQIPPQTTTDSKPYVPPVYTDEDIEKFKADLCGHCDDPDKCVCQYFKHDELAAIHRLDAWNKAYVLMCASRCTSVLVLVLP